MNRGKMNHFNECHMIWLRWENEADLANWNGFDHKWRQSRSVGGFYFNFHYFLDEFLERFVRSQKVSLCKGQGGIKLPAKIIVRCVVSCTGAFGYNTPSDGSIC